MFFAFWAIFVQFLTTGLTGRFFDFVISRQALAANQNCFIFHFFINSLALLNVPKKPDFVKKIINANAF